MHFLAACTYLYYPTHIKKVIHRAYRHLLACVFSPFSQCFLVNKSAFRYIVLFGNCMDPHLSNPNPPYPSGVGMEMGKSREG